MYINEVKVFKFVVGVLLTAGILMILSATGHGLDLVQIIAVGFISAILNITSE
jgi:hypothetical protein